MSIWNDTDWLAVDWGTTRLRAWAMGADDTVVASFTSDQGMNRVARDGFAAALDTLIGADAPDGLQVICCGMAGARQGWMEARYRQVPCTPLSPEKAVRAAHPRFSVRILPGLRQNTPADVMRGEETQIAGYLQANPGFDGILCLPGTHCKWVEVSAGEVVSFRTYMTGEFFDLLVTQSVLRHSVGDSEAIDETAFAEALSDALAHPARVSTAFFGLRARDLLEGATHAVTRGRLSGLLIGLELGGARPYWLGRPVAVIGSTIIADRYRTALAAQGVTSDIMDGDAAVRAGLASAREEMQ